MQTIFNKITAAIKTKWGIAISALVVLVVAGYFIFHKGTKYQFVTVQRGSITESVSITGNTTPQQSVSLAFDSSGIISHIYSDLGRRISAGQVLAELNTNDLVAQLHQAEANVATQLAKLQGLQSGSRPEDIASSQAALDKAKQDLANMYTGISDTSIDSYAKATDAVRIQISGLFSNAETQNPALTYTTSNSQAQTDVINERPVIGASLNKWQDQLSSISQSDTALETLLQGEISYLTDIRQLLNNLSKTLDSAPSLSVTALAANKAAVSTALNEVNTAVKNLNTISQNIASQKLTVLQLQAQLNLKNVGTLPTDISAQEAQVEQAKATVDSVKAKIQNSQIVAPISGTVTKFDAKIGQLATPSVPLVSIMADNGYEVDAGVSETDVGKILVGNVVTMTLDAFPNETFTGSVFYLAPSETNTQGVINYQVKISFDKADARLKSGLTANIDIQTKRKDNVLVLPQYAILQNNEGTFVETLENKTTKQNKVMLGIQDQKGNVEIISGVTEGEQVLNIGLKTQ
jgi:HlyD family secretion protein